MLGNLDEKWSYLPSYSLLQNYIEVGLDFALIGPSKTGKSELIRDLTRDTANVAIISCLRNGEPKKLEEAVGLAVYSSLNISKAIKHPSFLRVIEELYNYQGQFLSTEKLIVILENVENLLFARNRQFYEFIDQFANFLKEVNEVDECIKVQTVFVSRTDVTLDIPKVPMSLPSSSFLERYGRAQYLANMGQITAELLRKRLAGLESSFMAHLMSFDVTRRDFEIYDVLSTVLFRELLKALKNVNSVAKITDADSLPDFKSALKVLNNDIETAYLPINEFRDRVKAAMATGSDELKKVKLEIEWESRNRDLEKALSRIPETAAIMLIAFYIENVYKTNDVENILGKVKIKNKRRKTNQVQGSTQLTKIESGKQQHRKRIEMDRVISTAKQLMKNISEYLKTPEKKVEYCSLNMALNFDFLVKRGWIAKFIERNGKVYYHFMGDEKTIKLLVTERFSMLGEEIIKFYEN